MRIRGVAHRGYPRNYPENTLSSFQAAIDLGFTHMELDVHLSKDGVPVVMHDHSIDRMTDGKGEIKNYTLKELKQFNIEPDEKIPSLKEALLLAKDQIIVSIELKKPELYPGIEKKVYEVISKLDMIDQVYIISFNHKTLAKLRVLSSELHIGPLVSRVKKSHFNLIKKLNANYFAVKYDSVKDKHIKQCEDMDVQLVVWTVNREEDMTSIGNYPSVLVTTDELEKYSNLYLTR
ncbi:glycerophosphodiester phosphodiesterase [Ornithinibacillus sp. L9]|uniref:Glycerophosphodiester phosphodiesterase n=1 Tax=Ornithinibacillus caprae TaxID=2678566 RepID=A0A6N8FCF1_9BACI|nr:glycerophosphodiester phosphodiesterase family protein [Ornithinibacillus caprae]MUK87342.1 glycerophosphodiester phosphodiesterase [Ornithinibacillus caprae]